MLVLQLSGNHRFIWLIGVAGSFISNWSGRAADRLPGACT